MWNVNPKILCTKHLSGEHLELHMFTGTIRQKKRLSGYVQNNLVAPKQLNRRHEELAKEMEARGFTHMSPLEEVDISYLPLEIQNATVDNKLALAELLRRCPNCKARALDLEKGRCQNAK